MCFLPDEETLGVISAEQGNPQTPEAEQNNDDRQEEAQIVHQPQRRDVDYNWAEARRKMQELERRSQEQDELIARLSHKPAQNDDDDLSKLSEDDILTVKQARQLATKMARQVAQEAIREREAATVEDRLQSKFPDYAQVITKENVQILQQQEPEISQILYGLAHDPYQQNVTAYKLIKKLGIKTDATPSQDIKRAKENAAKPVSVQAVTKQSPIGQAHVFENGLTEELKKQYRSDMAAAIKRG